MATTVPMLAPDGSSGEIPQDKVQAAMAAGFKRAVPMTSPEGKTGYIPEDRAEEAAKAGFHPQHDFSSLTSNPKGEGTYKIRASDGQTVSVPYSNVPVFTQGLQGSSFASPEEQARFEADAKADPKRPTFWNALTNPVGSGGREQGVGGGALQVGGQAVKTLAQPILHPVDTVSGAYSAVRHPIDTVKGIAANVENDYQHGGAPLVAENAAGQLIGMVEGGRMMEPAIRAAGNGAGAVAQRAVLLGRTPEAAYETAMKIAPSVSAADRAAAVQTGLENAIPVSKAGVEKLGDLIDDVQNKVKGEIAKDPNRPIDPNAVATRADQARAKFSRQVNAGGDLKAIEASRQQFLAEQGAPVDAEGNVIGPAPAMPAEAAQAMKQGTYRVLKGKYGEQGSASVEAQKALARGLKEEIAIQFPEISSLNAAESKLLNLQPFLERAVNRISNHQLVGIGTPVAGAAATAVTGSTSLGKVAMVMKAVLDNPNVKSRLAIAVSKSKGITYPSALSKVQAYAASLGSVAPDAQGYSTADNANPAESSAQ